MKMFIISIMVSAFAAGSFAGPCSPKSSLEIKGQYYNASISGINKYLHAIKLENPDLHKKLKPLVVQMEKRKVMNRITCGSVFTTGIVMTVWGGMGVRKSVQEKEDNGDLELEPLEVVSLSLGGALIVASAIIRKAGRRRFRESFLDFINTHNKLNKESPLKLQMGFRAREKAVNMNLALKF
jgi:hypothetical protein